MRRNKFIHSWILFPRLCYLRKALVLLPGRLVACMFHSLLLTYSVTYRLKVTSFSITIFQPPHPLCPLQYGHLAGTYDSLLLSSSFTRICKVCPLFIFCTVGYANYTLFHHYCFLGYIRFIQFHLPRFSSGTELITSALAMTYIPNDLWERH